MAERTAQAKYKTHRPTQPQDLRTSPVRQRQPSVEPMSDDSTQDMDGGEKEVLIAQILDLQNTLHDLSQRVNSVKEENSKLKAENHVLNQYIENLMVTSGIFKSTSGK